MLASSPADSEKELELRAAAACPMLWSDTDDPPIEVFAVLRASSIGEYVRKIRTATSAARPPAALLLDSVRLGARTSLIDTYGTDHRRQTTAAACASPSVTAMSSRWLSF